MRYSTLALATAVPFAAGLVVPSNDQTRLGNLVDVPEGLTYDLNEQRLVQFAQGEAPVWISELDKITAKAQGKTFFDITETQEADYGLHTLIAKDFPSPNATATVKHVIKELSTKGPKENLETFTSFRTRYYRSATGRESQLWLLSKIDEITKSYASPSIQELISVDEFKHSWGQNSNILKIKGSNPSDEGAVIISAHQDSTNMWPWLPAPGADDIIPRSWLMPLQRLAVSLRSGSVTILEAYRALISSNFTPEEDVYFHWYSAEEGGLLGSQAVAKDWAARGVKVKAQIQFDMTAWVKKGTKEEIGIITDFVDPGLSKYVMKLVDAYLAIPYVETKCGYACSDHASWMKAGYRAAFSIESSFENSNHFIHSGNDRIDISPEFSFDHMLEFSKLAVAFAIELGGWKQ